VRATVGAGVETGAVGADFTGGIDGACAGAWLGVCTGAGRGEGGVTGMRPMGGGAET
jgi:hypothetical protein